MKVLSCAKLFVNSNIDKLQIVCKTYSRNDPKGLRNVFRIPKKEIGVYFLYKSGCDPMESTPIYIGETTSCVITRIRNHKKSLNLPEWKTERTGKKFINAGIDLNISMDIYYIPAKALGITNKKQCLFAESAFISIMNPIAFND